MISPLFTFCLRRKWWLAAVLLAMPTHGYAAPMVPANENTVLESLPVRPGDPRAALLRDLRAQLSRQPKDLALALKLAQAYYSQVAEEGDPRFIGYAEAALAPWWSAPDAPVDVLVLRASIKQYRHEFAEALADLSLAQARNPAYAPAWTTSAAIHTVQASYEEARKHCDKLLALTSRLIARGCSLSVDSINGKSAEAYTRLLKELQEAESQPQNGPSVEQKLWIQTRLGEMAQRTGDAVMGEKHFRAALALGISDGYLQAAYADLLLQQKRPAEVVAQLKDKTRSDLLLLRLTIAEQQLGRPEFASHRDALIARFEAARMRGDKVHQTEESRFNLQVLNNPREAIRLAQENWQVQREPRDARALLEAAAALNNFEAAHPVLQWMRTTGYEEADLRALAARLTHK